MLRARTYSIVELITVLPRSVSGSGRTGVAFNSQRYAAPPSAQPDSMLPGSRYRGKLARRPLSASYELTPELVGQGGYGAVWRGKHRGGGNVAVKVVPLPGCSAAEPARSCSRAELRASLTELEVMARVGSHESLLTLREAFLERGSLYLVTELMEDDLCSVLMKRERAGLKYDETTVCRFFYGLLRGLAHLHSHGVIHRDVKLDNIMLRRANDLCSAQLGDFGLATIVRFGEAGPSGAVGSLQYIAPEVLLSTDGNDSYSFSADMWSAGVVLYAVLSCTFPFSSSRKGGSERKILDGAFNFDGEAWSHVSAEAKSLIRKLLVVDPKRRLTAHRALRHPWFAELRRHEQTVARERAKSADSGNFWRNGIRDLLQQLTGVASVPTAGSSDSSSDMERLPSVPACRTKERRHSITATKLVTSKLPPVLATGVGSRRQTSG